MKKYNKFVPVAVLAGLCLLAVSMCNEECYAEPTSTVQYSSSSKNDGKTKESKTTLKRTTRKERRKNNAQQNNNRKYSKKMCKTGNCNK